mmetsp:Transcript_8440/g.20748  ORF Transcript_8440/g.20748 Transcript_8440/m.20748 type:complete len:201 (-) Transcript_8440:356-958(-)
MDAPVSKRESATDDERGGWCEIAFWVHSCRTPLLPVWFLMFWYIYIMGFFGVPDPEVWGPAVGIAFIVGCVLTGNMYNGPFEEFWRKRKYPTMRVFAIPFCVSSYSSTLQVRKEDFAFIFPKNAGICVGGLILAGILTSFVWFFRWFAIRKGLYEPGMHLNNQKHIELQESKVGGESVAPPSRGQGAVHSQAESERQQNV